MNGMNRDAIVRRSSSVQSVRPSVPRANAFHRRASFVARRASRVDDASRERARARGPWTRRTTTNHES